MGDGPRITRTPNLDLHSIFGISKAASLGKVYKSLIKWQTDKNPAEGKKQEEMVISDPIVPAGFEHNHHQKYEDHLSSGHSTLSRITSKRSKTPTHGRRFLSRNSSRRCTTPTPKSSYRSSETEFAPASLYTRKPSSRKSGRRCTTPTPTSSYRSSETEFAPVSPPRLRSLSRSTSRRCTTPTPKSSYRSSETEFAPASVSRTKSRKRSKTPSRTASLSRRNMNGRWNSETENPDNCSSPTNMAKNYSSEPENHNKPSLSRTISVKGATPIIFSQSTARRKPQPVEKKLECTLEELCFGGLVKLQYTRDVILDPGILAQEDDVLTIEIKPGWRKGTKITFEGKGDERPGYLAADIVFQIDEKQHPLFKRDGDNLEVVVKIPLVNALTDCAIPVPILGGETMTLLIEDTIIYPGYEKVIPGQGMLNSKQNGKRGDLHIQFLIDFPTELSDQQREEAVSFLQDCY